MTYRTLKNYNQANLRRRRMNVALRWVGLIALALFWGGIIYLLF